MPECEMNGCVREQSPQHALCPPCFAWLGEGNKGPAPKPEDDKEVPPLNPSLVANTLLDIIDNPKPDDKGGADPLLRSVMLDLHHLLEEDYGKKWIEPYNELRSTLAAFCEIEESPNNYKSWQAQRDIIGKSLLGHLRKHKLVEESGVWPPPMKAGDLKQFVTDLMADKLVTDKHLDDPTELMTVFAPLSLGALASRARHELSNIGLIYEYLDKAQKVEGKPRFFSIKVMNKADWAKCITAVKDSAEVLNRIEA